MAKVYSRMTKVNNVTGRSDYISNNDRQEFLILTEKSSDFDWKEYADFEKTNQKSKEKNNEARELVIALPNEMSENFSDEMLEDFSHDLAKELLGENRDYEFALHFNQAKTNFHMHLLFSERERATTREPKRYKRDMWFDKTTNRMAKANTENAELRYKKGEIMKDKQGNVRYDDALFTKKEKKFTERSWLKEHQKTIQSVLAEYNYVLDIFDSKNEIAHKKLYKGASADYLEYANHWNTAANIANDTLKEKRTELLEEYNVLKPLMNEYKFFSGKEDEMNQAELNIKIYENNGYSGHNWNFFKRTKYWLDSYEADKINVSMYKKLRTKIFNTVFNREIFTNPTQYFEQLIQKIKNFPETVKSIKDKMIKQYGTIERYKNYKHIQELARQEKTKTRQPKNELESRIERLRTKQKKEPTKQRQLKRTRKRGLSR